MNKYVDVTAPWVLAKDKAARKQLETVIYNLLEGLRIISGLIYPVMPDTAASMQSHLGLAADEPFFKLDRLTAWKGLQAGTQLKKSVSLFPRIDMDKKDAMAAHANMMTKFWKKYIPLTTGIDGANTTSLVFTQQARANTERANAPSYMQAAIKMWQIAGAYASRHYKLIDLVVWDGKTLKREKAGVKEVVGKMTKWELQKGKAGTHDNKTGEMALYYHLGGPDDIGELIASGTRRGVIQPAGKGVVVVRPDTKEVLQDFSAPSQKAFRKMLESDFEFELAVRREILTQAGLQCLYR